MNSTQDFIDEVKGCLRENVIVDGNGSIDLSPLYNQIDSINQSLREHSNNDDVHTSISEAAVIFSNPNLLDNPNFSINQRGQSEYIDANQYTVDRWGLYMQEKNVNNKVAVNDDKSITLTLSAGNWIRIAQIFEQPLEGTFTLSAEVEAATGGVTFDIIVSDGTQKTASWVLGGGKQLVKATFEVGAMTDVAFSMRNLYGFVTIKSVKLELGSVATPFVPPNPAVELAKCQRYYAPVFNTNGTPVQFNGAGIAVTNTMVRLLINLPNTLRIATPTAVLTGSLYLINSTHITDNSIPIKNINGLYVNGNILQLDVNVEGVTLESSVLYMLSRRDTATNLAVSADL